MRRRVLKESNLKGAVVQQLDTKAGDVVFYDTANNATIYYRLGVGEETIPKSCMPIGVVAVPAKDDLYSDYACGVMSLVYMDCNNPQKGSIKPSTMCWGKTGVDTSLPNKTKVPCVGYGANAGDENGTIVAASASCYFPSVSYSALQCPHDKNAYYHEIVEDRINGASPYRTSGENNPNFTQTASPSSDLNVLVESNGKTNTYRLISDRGVRDYSSWKPSFDNPDDYPAASCCDMFYTIGTKQGDWYLPSLNEVVRMTYHSNAINKSFKLLSRVFTKDCFKELISENYPHRLTSNENSSNNFWFLDSHVNGCGSFVKNNNDLFVAVAFTQVGALERRYGDIYISGGSTTDIPASGGSSKASGYSYSQTYGYLDSTTNGGVITSGGEVNVTSVSANSLGTTEKQRTKIGSSVVTVTMNGKTSQSSYDVYQAANVKTLDSIDAYANYSSSKPSAIPQNDWINANGGYIDAKCVAYYSYSSGDSSNADVTSSTTWTHQGNYGSISGNRFTVGSRGTTTGDDRYNYIYASFGGKTDSFNTGNYRNVRTTTGTDGGVYSYGDVVAGTITNATIAASGGSGTAKAGNGTQTWSRTAITTYYSYTSGSTSSAITTAASSGTNTISPSASSYTASANSKGTTLSDKTTVGSKAVTWSGSSSKSKSGTMYVYQAANTRSVKSSSGGVTTYENVVAGTISNKTIAASGGSATATAGNGSQKWSKSAVVTTYTYTSGSEKSETTTAASSGTNTISPNPSSYTASANSKGSTVSSQTTVGSKAVTWIGSGGKSASGTMYIYQAANKKEKIRIGISSNARDVICDTVKTSSTSTFDSWMNDYKYNTYSVGQTFTITNPRYTNGGYLYTSGSKTQEDVPVTLTANTNFTLVETNKAKYSTKTSGTVNVFAYSLTGIGSNDLAASTSGGFLPVKVN